MSKMIPVQSVAAFRQQQDVSVDIWGIPCDLFIPSNLNSVEDDDQYGDDSQYTYDQYTTLVWIVFNPESRRLRKLGMYVEDETPMLASFKSTAIDNSDGSEDGDEVEVDVTIGSYIRVDITYVPTEATSDETHYEEFEVADVALGPLHDSTVSKVYKLVARRVDN